MTRVKQRLKAQMTAYLEKTGDPRALGKPVFWDQQHYYKDKDWVGTPRKEARKKFGLKEAYSYRSKN